MGLAKERSSGKNSEFYFLPILYIQKAKHALGTKCNGSQPINVKRNKIGKGITIKSLELELETSKTRAGSVG